jgi:predicted deacylase
MRFIGTVIVRICFLWCLTLDSALALQFQRYHDQREIATFLREQAQQFPGLARFEVLGRSQQGREIALLTLSKSWSKDTPALYFNGTHHGNEKASTEAVLALIKHLIDNRDQDEVDRLLRRYRIILQPLVNPDGHALGLRTDSRGIDPNRDYPSPGKKDKPAFRLVETRLVRKLLQRETIVAAATVHSGLEAVLWPWCHTPQLSQHDPIFKSIGEAVARSMGMPRYTQSYYDYKTYGEFIDYAYMRHGIYALTLEVSTEPKPPLDELPDVTRRAIRGSMSFMLAVDRLMETIVADRDRRESLPPDIRAVL